MFSFDSLNMMQPNSIGLHILRLAAKAKGDPVAEINALRAVKSAYTAKMRDRKIIFIHIPKAAGNSISKAIFGSEATVHAPLFRYFREDPNLFLECYIFGIVRNPWDRFVSAFHYLKQGGKNQFDKRVGEYLLSGIDFQHFISKIGNEKNFRSKIMNQVHFVSQSKFIDASLCPKGIDDLFRLEDMATAESGLSARLGRDIRFARVNASERDDYRAYFKSARDIEIVGALYRDDVAALGYAFE